MGNSKENWCMYQCQYPAAIFYCSFCKCSIKGTWVKYTHILCIITQFSSVAHSCLTLCDPMNCSMPGLPVHHQCPGLTQTHVHQVSDAIKSIHPLSSPSPPALNASQNQSLFQWVGSSHQVTTVLELQLHYQSFQMNIQSWFPLRLTGLISLQSKGL